VHIFSQTSIEIFINSLILITFFIWILLNLSFILQDPLSFDIILIPFHWCFFIFTSFYSIRSLSPKNSGSNVLVCSAKNIALIVFIFVPVILVHLFPLFNNTLFDCTSDMKCSKTIFEITLQAIPTLLFANVAE